jgi:hypothetical protein
MSSGHHRVAKVIVLVWSTVLAFTNTAAQEGGSQHPDVSDWRTFHHQNDEYWARLLTATTGWRGGPGDRSKVEVTAGDVRAIRILAGIADDEPSDPILEFVGGRMREDQYLLVTAKANSCVHVAVYEKHFRHPNQVWSIDALPDGSEICQPSGCAKPRVTVNEKHKISILTFLRSSPDQPVCDRLSSVTYRPKGDSFEAEDGHTSAAMCWGDSFFPGLNLAFKQAAGPGETLAIVQVLPVLGWDKYALVLRRKATALTVLRMELNREDWEAPILSSTKATASECFSRAQSVSVSVKTLDIAENRAQALVKSLDSLDFGSDHCARGADSQCAFFLDGRAFYVQVGDHAPLRLTDVEGMKGYASENPAMSAWVYRLLEEAKHAKQIATK